MDWRPVLDDADRTTAVRVAHEIATVLQECGPELLRGADGERHSSLACGPIPTGILLAYCKRAGLGPWPRLQEFIARGVEDLQDADSGIALFGGFPGMAWGINHAVGNDTVSLEEVDEGLRSVLSCALWQGDFDLMNGLCGLGVYSLTRRGSEAGDACVRAVIRHLEASAEWSEDMVAWRTPVGWLQPRRQAEFPDGYFDLGVAHGIAGIIGFLARAHAVGYETEHLLLPAVRWLRSRKTDHQFRFPYVVAPGRANGTGRGVWCNGDLGISLALLSAASVMESPSLYDEAVATAKHCLLTLEPGVHLTDACLCHGSAGVAHAAARLFNATGDEWFRASARKWAQLTLTMRDAPNRLGGYLFTLATFTNDGPPTIERVENTCFLSGLSGVALVMLSLATEVEPAWDSVLLCS